MNQKLFKIAYGLFIAVVLALGILLLASLIPVPGNFEIKIVQSGSMEPAIRTGSIVVIKPSESYQVNDVITFGRDTRTEVPTTHRIISERVDSGIHVYTTKGDANENPDPKEVRKSEVKGKILFSVPYIGYLLDFARKPVGFVLLIILPAVMVIVDEVTSIWKEVKARRKDSPTEEKNTAEEKEHE